MSSEEEKAVHDHDQTQIDKARRERQAEALREDEREGIAMVLHTTEDVGQAALELGFDQETARVLPLVPLIQVAWADGKVSGAESRKVLHAAEHNGILPNSPAYEFLELMLETRPSKLFFERTMNVIKHMFETSQDASFGDRPILELTREVAEASGGFFGLGNTISEEEQALLDEFAQIFELD